MDCDLLIRDDLFELYNTDISNYSAAGVSDYLSTYYRTSFGMKKDDIYINSGVMLINLKYWRDEQLSDKFLQFSESQGNKLPYAEQGMVNGVLTSTIKLLPLQYNSYTAIFDFNYDELLRYRKPKNYYSREQVEEAKNSPTIVHFTTSFASLRPWVEGSKHPYDSEWLKYKAISPWADEPLRKDNRSKKKKIFLSIFNFLPRRVAVNLAGLLHSVLVSVLRK
ncbi:MAG: hypothetical protein LUH03_03340 [Oscillospiraceae bacterium]|nr:hypothetical protein [Oscillospiraceae bacterium]